MQSLHEHKVKVIRHSRKSIFGPLTSHVLLHLIQQQPKTLTSNFAKNAARINVLESKFLARSARTEQSLHFFRVPKARFSSTSNERDSVTGDSLSRPNRKNRLCGRHEKNCRKQRLDSASQCNSSAVSDLIVVEPHRC